MRVALGLFAVALSTSVHSGHCVGRSGPHTSALVELYTGGDCSGCPAARRRLSSLASRASVVPLVLQLEERREDSVRRRRLTPRQRLALVYTPQVLLQGRPFRRWETPAFDEALATIERQPARARIELEIVSVAETVFRVRVGAEILDATPSNGARVYFAAYEKRPHSEQAVFEWQGPAAFSGPRLEEERDLPLFPGARVADSGVVAFVQSRRSGEVLQAVQVASCP